jgi:hypothetical protein
VLFGGFVKTKIRNEMIGGLAFSTASAAIFNFILAGFPVKFPILGRSETGGMG